LKPGTTTPRDDPPFPVPPGIIPISRPLADTTERLTWRLEDICRALGISRRSLERERSAGRFPRPDLRIGRMPLWAPETIRRWVEAGGRP
jgi:predicted DNA-binding transcriptional regulator AlpA